MAEFWFWFIRVRSLRKTEMCGRAVICVSVEDRSLPAGLRQMCYCSEIEWSLQIAVSGRISFAWRIVKRE